MLYIFVIFWKIISFSKEQLVIGSYLWCTNGQHSMLVTVKTGVQMVARMARKSRKIILLKPSKLLSYPIHYLEKFHVGLINFPKEYGQNINIQCRAHFSIFHVCLFQWKMNPSLCRCRSPPWKDGKCQNMTAGCKQRPNWSLIGVANMVRQLSAMSGCKWGEGRWGEARLWTKWQEFLCHSHSRSNVFLFNYYKIEELKGLFRRAA